jgi:hypothetical protein
MNNYLTSSEAIDLKRLINENECDNNTNDIRKLKHSSQIQQGINDLISLKQLHPELSNDDFAEMAKSQCSFLLENYTDIFMKIIKNELDFDIMAKLLHIFKMIEDEKVDQHSASVLVGKLLKELYVDSAIRRGNNLDELHAKDAPPAPTDGLTISWKEFKTQRIIQDN